MDKDNIFRPNTEKIEDCTQTVSFPSSPDRFSAIDNIESGEQDTRLMDQIKEDMLDTMKRLKQNIEIDE